MIEARLLQDCASNLRIRYQLPVPLSVELLRSAGADRIETSCFSAIVPGASDHIRACFTEPAGVRAEGVLGGRSMTVTYGSLHAVARPEAVATIERQLEAAIGVASKAQGLV